MDTYELESPRKRLFHRITGWLVVLAGSGVSVFVFNFLATH